MTFHDLDLVGDGDVLQIHVDARQQRLALQQYLSVVGTDRQGSRHATRRINGAIGVHGDRHSA